MSLEEFMLQTVQRLQALETTVSLMTKVMGAVGITVLGSIGSRLYIWWRKKNGNGGKDNG